jgi:hypothetical protein
MTPSINKVSPGSKVSGSINKVGGPVDQKKLEIENRRKAVLSEINELTPTTIDYRTFPSTYGANSPEVKTPMDKNQMTEWNNAFQGSDTSGRSFMDLYKEYVNKSENPVSYETAYQNMTHANWSTQRNFGKYGSGQGGVDSNGSPGLTTDGMNTGMLFPGTEVNGKDGGPMSIVKQDPAAEGVPGFQIKTFVPPDIKTLEVDATTGQPYYLNNDGDMQFVPKKYLNLPRFKTVTEPKTATAPQPEDDQLYQLPAWERAMRMMDEQIPVKRLNKVDKEQLRKSEEDLMRVKKVIQRGY